MKKIYILGMFLILSFKNYTQELPPVVFSGSSYICNSSPWKLVFYDDFNGTAINLSKWYTFNTNNGGTNDNWCEARIGYPGNYSIHRDANVVVSGSTVKLKLRQQTNTWQCASCDVNACTPGFGDEPLTRNYTSGYLSSTTTYNNGKFEARLKMPKFDYSWATAWLWHTTMVNEIDFAESSGGHGGILPVNTYNLHAWSPPDPYNIYSLPDVMSYPNTFPYQSWFHWISGTNHKMEDWHTYTCEWDTARIKISLDGEVVNTIWKYYKYKVFPYRVSTFYIAKVGSGCFPSAGSWKTLEGFPYNNESNSKLIFSLGITTPNKILGSDGELGQMEIDYVKVYQRDPASDGHSEICAESTYPVVGSEISGSDFVCTETTFTISPSASNGTWNYSSWYMDKVSETSGSIVLDKGTPYTFTGGYIEYNYSNGVEGCPLKSIKKFVSCPFSISTTVGSISAFDETGKFRFHFFSDIYQRRDVTSTSQPSLEWKISYNKGIDSFNPNTATTYKINGLYALSPVVNQGKQEKYNLKWELKVKLGLDSVIYTGERNSQSGYFQQPFDTNVYFFDAHLPSLDSFDQSTIPIINNIMISEEEYQDTLFLNELVERVKIQLLEPYLYFGNLNEYYSEEAMARFTRESQNTGTPKTLIYPNPTSQFISLNLSATFSDNININYTIFNTKGQVVKQGVFKEHIEVADLTIGNYILELKQNTHHEYIKFMKE